MALLERICDKEWTIRAVACHGLGVLARAEASLDEQEDEDSDDRGSRISPILRTLCQYDLQPHVRTAALPGISLPLNIDTLPFLLSRTRDVDASVRKAAFRIVQQVPVRGLSVAQRSLIIRNGLGDREAAVRTEVGKLVYHWAITCSDYQHNPKDGKKGAQKSDVKIDVDEFLDLFDLWDGTVAEEALKALVYKRPNILDDLDLSKGMSSGRFHDNYTYGFTFRGLLGRLYPFKSPPRTRIH
jgi:condensin complex subunit 3